MSTQLVRTVRIDRVVEAVQNVRERPYSTLMRLIAKGREHVRWCKIHRLAVKAAERLMDGPAPIYGTIAQIPRAHIDGDTSAIGAYLREALVREEALVEYLNLHMRISEREDVEARYVFQRTARKLYVREQSEYLATIRENQVQQIAARIF